MDQNIANKIDPDEIKRNLKDAREKLIKSYMTKNFTDQILSLNKFIDKLEKDIIKYALLISEENQKKAAFLLGLNIPTLCEKMKKYNIKMNKPGKEKALLRSLEEIASFFSQKENR